LPNAERSETGLTAANGEPIPAAELLAALDAYFQPPKPKVVQAPAPPLSRAMIGQRVFVR
jgi:hypothetical protein